MSASITDYANLPSLCVAATRHVNFFRRSRGCLRSGLVHTRLGLVLAAPSPDCGPSACNHISCMLRICRSSYVSLGAVRANTLPSRRAAGPLAHSRDAARCFFRPCAVLAPGSCVRCDWLWITLMAKSVSYAALDSIDLVNRRSCHQTDYPDYPGSQILIVAPSV
jgi:hypothetical protein